MTKKPTSPQNFDYDLELAYFDGAVAANLEHLLGIPPGPGPRNLWVSFAWVDGYLDGLAMIGR